MNDCDFEKAVSKHVEAKLPGTFDGTAYVKGDRIARLSCENGTAYLYLFADPSFVYDKETIHSYLGTKSSYDVERESVQMAADAIVWHLSH